MLNTTIFADVSPETRDNLTKEIIRLSLPRGSYVFQEGDVNTGIFLIKKGIVKLYILDTNDRESIFDFHGRGELLGDRSIFSKEDHYYTAKCITDVELELVPKTLFLEAVKMNPFIMNKILVNMSDESIRHIRHSQLLSQANLKQRMAFCFIYLQQKNTDPNNWTIETNRDDISNFVGTVKESAVRIMHEFKEKGIIESSGRRIHLLKPTELLALAKISL